MKFGHNCILGLINHCFVIVFNLKLLAVGGSTHLEKYVQVKFPDPFLTSFGR